jgi:hypothetical protein
LKAGLVGGSFFGAAVAVMNYALLEASKGSALSALAADYPACSGASAAQGCFSKALSVGIPLDVFLPASVVAILFGTLYGMYFEYLPGGGYKARAAAMAILMLLLLLLFGLAGISVDEATRAIMNGLDGVAMVAFALIIAHLYRRFTREVRFETPSPERLTIKVDGRDFTERTRTLSLHSTHRIKAPGEGRFHSWLVSGGVSVTDPKSSETTMKVEGDGLLKVS